MELLRLILIRILTPHPWSWRYFQLRRTACDQARFPRDLRQSRPGGDCVETRTQMRQAPVEIWGYLLSDAVGASPMAWVSLTVR